MERIRFRMAREGNIVAIFVIYPDESCKQIALYEVPNDRNWRADVDFYDNIKEVYKKRYTKIY